MRRLTRGAAALVLGSALTSAASAQAPVAPPTPVGSTPGGVPVVTPAHPEQRPTGVAAIVNNKPIPEVAVYRALRQFPPANWSMARKEILAHMIENEMIDQYLTAIKITPDLKEFEKTIADIKKELAEQKPPKDYLKELEAMMLTEAEFNEAVVAQLKWEKFVTQMATEPALKKTFEDSPDVFDGSLVRARHILLNPGTDPAKQKEAEGKLLGIRAAVEKGVAEAIKAMPPEQAKDPLLVEQVKATKTEELFQAYAKEYSVCPSKMNGGDLNWFQRAGAMVEPFAKAAYALQPYQMSGVVMTEFGYHLILVTARKHGSPKKYEEVKEDVKLLYQMRLREAVIAQMKPKAQIEIKPAPVYPQQQAAGPAMP